MTLLFKQLPLNPHFIYTLNPNLSRSIIHHTRIPTLVQCNHTPFHKTEPSPIFTSVKTFAPVTFDDLGTCFDFLSVAIDGIGNTITLSLDPTVHPGSISISSIQSSDPTNSKNLISDPLLNYAGIATIATMRKIGVGSVGLSISVEKGLPFNDSRLGSSIASAAAAAVVAVNELFGRPLPVSNLIPAGLGSDAKSSGCHVNNIAAAIMGGFVLSNRYDPLDLIPLWFPPTAELFFVIATPEFNAPPQVPPFEKFELNNCRWNCRHAVMLMDSVFEGDGGMLGSSTLPSNKILEQCWAFLIPGLAGVKRAALEAGAFGCTTINSVGPNVIAVIDDEDKGNEIGARMVEAFLVEGKLKASSTVRKIDRVGARVISFNCL
ncbi:homoserine kinase-like [Magnolia sinica]|uniref:homoserine kinase-like n=1 Tax=Magnolia sinica TaxID=86752 RepID=UPI00265B07D2|nr:homoserine kinase-like [Magnolia sinica]